ncbi:MAG: VOC family protein [Deltaproteobacteria bacterium]|nr:VOC family protein [Deltaproteobacteria bacterium]
MTPDAAGARAFYGALFGWKFEVGGPETGHYGMAKLDGRNAAGVGTPPPRSHLPPAWSVYFATADLEATVAAVREGGGTVVTGPTDVQQEGRLAFFTDPTGAQFGAWQAMRHTGAQVVDEPGALCRCEVATPDEPRARDFYRRVFGREPTLVQMAKAARPRWMTYFGVANADASAQCVVQLGGKVSVPPYDGPRGRIAVVADPAGAVFSIMSARPRGSAVPASG